MGVTGMILSICGGGTALKFGGGDDDVGLSFLSVLETVEFRLVDAAANCTGELLDTGSGFLPFAKHFSHFGSHSDVSQ